MFSDRDKVFLELCKLYLRKTGVTVFTCENGKDALDIVRDKRPHVVVMSADMPVMNGVDCCRQLKTDESLQRIPVLLTLLSFSEEQAERCRQAGCDDILLKPVNQQALHSVIKKYVTLNKRMAPRFHARFAVNWDSGDGPGNSGHSVDISTRGIYLASQATVSAGSLLSLDFRLPASDMDIRCKARVAWANHNGSGLKPSLPAGFGLEFVDLSEESCRGICEYIRKEHIEPIMG